MAFGVRDGRRVALSVGTHAGWCLWSVAEAWSCMAEIKTFFQWFSLGCLLVNWTLVNSYSCSCLTGLVFLPLPILSLHTSLALTAGLELICLGGEPRDFGRSCKWPWKQKVFKAEIVLDFYLLFTVPISAAVKKKKKRQQQRRYHLILHSASSKTDLPLN